MVEICFKRIKKSDSGEDKKLNFQNSVKAAFSDQSGLAYLKWSIKKYIKKLNSAGYFNCR